MHVGMSFVSFRKLGNSAVLPDMNEHSDKIQKMLTHTLPYVNVSRMSQKLLRTQPYIVENRGITMAPLDLRLIS